ncbi:cell envelope biogenesis protein OmpA [Pseudaestuariivita atlantica]|uniref:Cell envelope biogenesis protein OmpA n=2 Tax=Pseudaestuariivita atlantica TaxID=1317121 RepID=A0A0L1JSG2_9RHOB|nr:cell envelope biogenesis protein OmpA [Pseudaestuariivita atlantica]
MPATGRTAAAAALLSLLAVTPLSALDLPRGAVSDGAQVRAFDSYALPTGPWSDGLLPTETFEGRVSRQAWRIPVAGLTTLQLIAPLRDQLEADGFDIVFECQAEVCGGFDFRFSIDVLPAPEMFVDLARYRFLSAWRAVDGARSAVSVLVSRTDEAGFVQIIQAGDAAAQATVTATASRVTSAGALSLGEALETDGRYILSDLAFETGSSALGAGPFASLATLADYLKANPGRRVALVGHTDSTGSLDGNIALSKRRAGSVRQRLIDTHGVPAAQMAAEGMGYLAPLTSNLTPEGRDRNRRVEVILISTE